MKHNVVKSTLLRFAAVMLLVMGTVPASAQYYMNVIKKNGETVKVAVDDIDSIAFFGKFTLSVNLPKADSLYLGTDRSQLDDVYEMYYIDPFEMDPFVLTHSFSDWGFGMGFTYSSLTDTITPGYTNNSAITGKGVSTNAYFTANTGGEFLDIPAEITFKDGKAYKAKECYVTNSTYAYRAIKDHNDGNGEYAMVKQWGEDDWFKLTITGYNGSTETGQIDFLLADGMNIVNTWQKIDLSSLGEVTSISFSLSSTDNGSWGMNTPSYFCLDQLTVIEE
jgi:hypothetical protein